MTRLLLINTLLTLQSLIVYSQSASDKEIFISNEKGKAKFTISASGKSSPMLISSEDWPGVIRAFKDLQADIGKVTSIVPEIYYDVAPASKEIIISGTIGKSNLIDKLIKDIESNDWKTKEEVKQSRPDADQVHADGFYFFDIQVTGRWHYWN